MEIRRCGATFSALPTGRACGPGGRLDANGSRRAPCLRRRRQSVPPLPVRDRGRRPMLVLAATVPAAALRELGRSSSTACALEPRACRQCSWLGAPADPRIRHDDRIVYGTGGGGATRRTSELLARPESPISIALGQQQLLSVPDRARLTVACGGVTLNRNLRSQLSAGGAARLPAVARSVQTVAEGQASTLLRRPATEREGKVPMNSTNGRKILAACALLGLGLALGACAQPSRR